MKLNKAEVLIEQGEDGLCTMRINESGSHQRPAWKPLADGPWEDLWTQLHSERLVKAKIIITYRAKQEEA